MERKQRHVRLSATKTSSVMIRNGRYILMTALMAAAGFTASAANAGQRLVVEKNHTVRVALNAPASSVIVGNPEIADVNVVDSRTVYILGKGFGNSSVTITGRDGRALFDGEVSVTAVRQGAITVYKGLKPSLMVCTNVCIAEDMNDGNTSSAGAAVAAPVTAP
jgi:Flp pilus assembly secretin CpaC